MAISSNGCAKICNFFEAEVISVKHAILGSPPIEESRLDFAKPKGLSKAVNHQFWRSKKMLVAKHTWLVVRLVSSWVIDSIIILKQGTYDPGLRTRFVDPWDDPSNTPFFLSETEKHIGVPWDIVDGQAFGTSVGWPTKKNGPKMLETQ